MKRFFLAGCCLFAWLSAAPVWAWSPSLNQILPRGGQRGTEVEVSFRGQRLDDAQEVLFHTPGFTVREFKVTNDQRVDVKLHIDADCRLGEHAMRLRTGGGISDLRTFWVGQFPTVREVEPNSDFNQPQKIDLNVTVEGVVENEDVDYYRVEAKKGQRISAEIEGIRLGLTLFDPYVAIMDMRRFELASSDDTALLLQDSSASIIVPEDGAYVIQVREAAYGGNNRCHYRLHVGSFPRPRAVYPAGGMAGEMLEVRLISDVAGEFTQSVTLPAGSDEVYGFFARQDSWQSPSPNPLRVCDFGNVLEAEPNDSPDAATSTSQAMPAAFNGIIEKPGDVDWFRFDAKKGQRFEVRVYARALRTPLDSVLSIHDVEGKQLAENDDSGGPDSRLNFDVPQDGSYLLRITDQLGNGGPDFVYRIEVTPRAPALALSIPPFARNDTQTRQMMAVPRGNRFATLINASRSQFSGDLVFEAADLPAGVSLLAETMPAGLSQIPVVFEAAPEAQIGGRLLTFRGRHADVARNIGGIFRQNVEMVHGAPNNTVYYYVSVDQLAVAVVEESPFTIDLVEPTVPVVQNGSMGLKVVATRREGFTKPITVRMLWNPPGIGSSTTVTIPESQQEVIYPINAGAKAQTATWKIVVLGEADDDKGKVVVASKPTPLTVAAPYLGMSIAMTAVEQGKEAEVVCKIEQSTPFEGKATVKLLGLPAKVTAPEKEITKDDAEVIFPLTVAADSPAGKHGNLFCQVTIMKGDAPIVHSVGGGGVLRIDPPPPPKKDEPQVAAAPPPPEVKKEEAPAEKRLTRLEQLRLEAQRKAENQ